MPHKSLFLNLFRHSEGTPYAAGQTIVEAGATGRTMYMVLEGEIEVRIGTKEVEVAGPGSIFGEMALIDDSPRSATVVAKTDCRLAEIDQRRFEFMVQETPFFALAVMQVMADRLRRANANVTSV